MSHYIFLKSLRSLEEFRKNFHVKIPPKSPSTNFQSLGKFKNPIFNSEIPFSLFSARPTLRPTRPLAQPARWPCHPRRPKLSGRPTQPARRSCLRGKYVSLFVSRLPSWPPLPRLSVNRAPAVRSTPSSCRLTQSMPPPRLAAIDHPAPPGLHHCDVNQNPLLPRLDSPS
jgi:hypothetical protein